MTTDLRACAKNFAAAALAGIMLLPSAAPANDEARDRIATASAAAVAELAQLRGAGSLNSKTSLEVIRRHLSPDIHFARLTQIAAGKHWRNATEAERDALTAQFRILLENTYAVTMAKFTHQKVAVVESRDLDDGTASVKLEVSDGHRKAGIENIMANIDGAWGVIDIKVEGVSLASNYRRQFDGVVRKFGVGGLIKALAKKNG